MPANEVMNMIGIALQAMVVGVSGVFAVLAVFYFSVKVLMSSNIEFTIGEDDD